MEFVFASVFGSRKLESQPIRILKGLKPAPYESFQILHTGRVPYGTVSKKHSTYSFWRNRTFSVVENVEIVSENRIFSNCWRLTALAYS